MAESRKIHAAQPTFEAIRQNEVPKGREGKHKKVVDQLLQELDHLAPGAALKVRLASLATSKANIRSALNRATRKTGLAVSTSSDSDHLYLWKSMGKT